MGNDYHTHRASLTWEKGNRSTTMKLAMKSRVYGIDLGTTNSAIAFVNDDGRPEIIANSDNERVTPSVVYFDEPMREGEPGNIVVGTIAKESAKIDPARVISFVKQEMGTGWTKELDGITLTPEKVSAFILRRLISDAEKSGHLVRDAIITCPAYFGDAERKATRAAGEIAGLNVVRVIDEPVAAVMHYGLDKLPDDSTVIVYDLGGGTFDVTVVAIEDGHVHVVCSDGNHRLGGKNWDERLVEYFASKFAEATGTDTDAILGDQDSILELQLIAELAKRTLSVRNSAKVKVSLNGCSERIEITRDIFNEITKDLLDQTIELTEKMIDFAATRYDLRRIDNFVLVGGSTRMPQVVDKVTEKFGNLLKNPPRLFEPDEAVAKGAAVFGTNCEFGLDTGALSGCIMMPAMHSYGIQVLDRNCRLIVSNLIRKGVTLPTVGELEIPVSNGDGMEMSLKVFENDNPSGKATIAESMLVGVATLVLPPDLPSDEKIKVTLRMEDWGELALHAINVSGDKMVEVHSAFILEKNLRTDMNAVDPGHRIYGIDFGGTNSAIAFLNDDDKAEIIPNSDNERITSSVVYFEEPTAKGAIGNAIVGKIAKEVARTDPSRAVALVKQELGTGWTKEIDGQRLTPEKVSSCILGWLAKDSKLCGGHDVKDVVIAYPAYFHTGQKMAMKAACEMAGLNVLKAVTEPVAAAMHYGLNKLPADNNAIVYDLGGSTFTATLLSIKDGEINLVCCNGDEHLGGKDWDERIVQYFASKFAEATGTDADAILGDQDSILELQLIAELAKHTLSVRNSAKVKVSLNGCSERIEIARDIFNEITNDLLDRTIELTEMVLEEAAAKNIKQIDNFVLVGGSTRMPQVLAAIKEKFGTRVLNEPLSFEVDEAVAKGAALFGMRYSFRDRLTGTPGSNANSEVTIGPDAVATIGDIYYIPSASRSYGVRLATDASHEVDNMLIKDEALPLECTREFPMPGVNSDKMTLQVFANKISEKKASSDACEEVGEVVVRLPQKHSGNMSVRVRLALSEDDVLSVDISYVTITPGVPAHVEFLTRESLSMDDIESARKEIVDLVIE